MDNLKMLPCNVEAEKSILSSILVSGGCAGEVVGFLSPDDFYDIRNRKVFEAVAGLFEEGGNIDPVTVADRIKGDFPGGSTLSYLAGLFQSFVPVSLRDYGSILREASCRRKVIGICHNMMMDAYGDERGVEDIIFSSLERLYDLREGKTKDIIHAGKAAMDALGVMEENCKNGGGMTGISTGFYDIDREINGLNRGDFIVIAARSSMGKTALALNIARNVSGDHTTAYFSMEMPANQLVFRMFSMMTNIRVENIRKGKVADKDFVEVTRAGDELHKGRLFIDDTSSLTMAEIKSKCRKLKMKVGLDVVFVDYIGLIESRGKSENRQQEISRISRNLKNLAMELDVAVIALSQLNRAPEARSGNRPQLGDLRESGAIEQDADIVILLYRDDYYNPDSKEKGVVECIIAKNRNGPVGVRKLGWNGEFQSFVKLKSRP